MGNKTCKAQTLTKSLIRNFYALRGEINTGKTGIWQGFDWLLDGHCWKWELSCNASKSYGKVEIYRGGKCTVRWPIPNFYRVI